MSHSASLAASARASTISLTTCPALPKAEAARLQLDVAALGHHVRRRAALDSAHVRGRLGVEPPERMAATAGLAAAAIALWPASGRSPAWEAWPRKRALTE